ncbi:methyltransferase [Streptomyces sp. NBC_01218]|uniref:HemK2/MTQ2 family protein methyltransferase n=1 Tax=unclassified Streptomyces TaxID=2593676 RepID=UPI0023B91D5F|nr:MULTISPECIES: HemK2/MTQ2 family protein methyltransferase [unclassified Streptomyces]WEH38276.1 methyltransferase [Streptomyces sp. AM 2-1-1]WSQ49938.1 methyltransferase [Streptomyces sp. NBC_01218]
MENVTLSTGRALPRPGRVVRLPGVYAPQTDSYFLASAMRREGIGPGMDVLDLCTGTGALALRAALLGARTTAVDISRRAVATARLNASIAGLPVAVHRSDLLSAVRGRRFDAVVSNPPYVPSPRPSLPRRGTERAWDAGLDGRALVDRICDAAPDALKPGGLLLMVHSALSDPEASLRRLERAGLSASISDRLSIPFGPVLRGRLGWLRERGLLPVGQSTEELVIVRARKN